LREKGEERGGKEEKKMWEGKEEGKGGGGGKKEQGMEEERRKGEGRGGKREGWGKKKERRKVEYARKGERGERVGREGGLEISEDERENAGVVGMEEGEGKGGRKKGRGGGKGGGKGREGGG